MKVLTDAEYAEAVSLCRDAVEAASSFDVGPMVSGHFLGKLRDLLAPPVIRGAPMSAPEPSTGTQGLAEKVARAWWERRRVEEDINLTWEQIGQIFHESHRKDATRWLAAMEIAGLAVVELPEPDEGGQIPTWRDGSGNRWTAWNEGVEDEFDCLIEDLDRLRRTAAVILAACAASERMAAEHQGGDPR